MKVLYRTLLLFISSTFVGLLCAGDNLGDLDQLQQDIKTCCESYQVASSNDSVYIKVLQALQVVVAHVTASTEDSFIPDNDFWGDVFSFAQAMDALTESLNMNQPVFYEKLANTARSHSPSGYNRETLAESLLVFGRGTAISVPSSTQLNNLTRSVDLTIAAGLFLGGLDRGDESETSSSDDSDSNSENNAASSNGIFNPDSTSGEFGLVYTAEALEEYNRKYLNSILQAFIH